MSLTTPTTNQLSYNIIAQLEATLNQTIPLLPKSFLRVLARALSGVFILLYKYAGFMFLQVFVRTATDLETTINGRVTSPLIEWGRLIGVGDPAAATDAELTVTVTVESQTGTLPSGSQLVSSDTGVTYITLGAVALTSATVSVTVRAVSDQAGSTSVGAAGNLGPGAVISFANPLANVARNAVVTAQTVTGADAESTGAYRQRVIDKFQKRPQGGAYADYEQWGEEPAGILNVYPYTSSCPGQVDVYVEATAESSGNADGIPTAAQLQEVLDSIELDSNGLASRRPANALINTFAITRTGFDVQVQALQVENLAAVQQEIETALTEYFKSREPRIFGLSVPPRKDRITRTAVGGVVENIVTANDGVFGGVILNIGLLQTDAYTLGEGEKAKLNAVSFA